ncbi:uncharacterized protein F4807DRAFT_260704 [Annulohypoxylon truncatum]|uniref:uncharacterized protein n=1 Tax=Annulohypoxylon truncatum TaxID=327061 RepID=UPI0020080921|nr:uncharacterized protein F4807DRAFT_260704 [Annulohypoxylon truncatum]KAI1213325.1 hypothetical protein F4807DRAFT_260704 [Annulohypoxylon truncatum]
MAPIGKLALAALFAGLSVFGFRASMGQMGSNGMGKLLREVTGAGAEILGAPTPFKRAFTGIEGLDKHLSVLVAFFAALVDDGGAGWEVTAFYVWGMAQFAAGWTALVLEGRRSGNRGRIVSWVGTAGLIFQNLTWTFIVPLYLTLHLFTSPIAKLGGKDAKSKGDAARQSLFVYLWDLALLPLAVTLGLVVPTIVMSLPSLLHQSAATHYNWIAFWQAFPLWTVLILDVLHNACYFLFGSLTPQDAQGKPTTPGNGFMAAVSGVYQFGLTISAVTHIPIFAVSLLPDPLRSSLASAFPKFASLFSQVTFARTFVPHPLSAPLTVDPSNYGPGDLAPLVINFLQYDLYTGNTTLFLWALYLHITTSGRSLAKSLGTAIFWTLVSGPTGAALALLWDRDELVKEGESKVAIEAKTK